MAMKTNRYIADIRSQEPGCSPLARTNPSLAGAEELRESAEHGFREQDIVTDSRDDRDLRVDSATLQCIRIFDRVLRVPGMVIFADDEPNDHVPADMRRELKRLQAARPSSPD